MYIRYSCLILIFIVYAHSLKCRTREHMKQQQDFYNLASNCMKTSINPNQHTSTSGGSSSDFRPKPQSNNRNNHDERQQDNRQQDNRQDRNRINFSANANDMSKNRNMCPDEYYHRNINSNAYREEPYYQRKEKRDTVTVQKYNRKNSTSAGSKNKSPLEDIGACVIHCIFKEMKMLNSDNKADRLAMTGVMTNRIRDPELKEFIQDSIEECFDIMDTEQFIVDVEEEHCDFSKKLILCLEEKAKRGCEDWEIRDNSTTHTEFNFNKEDEDRTHNENQNTNQNAYFTSNNKFQNRYPSFNTGQRRT